MNDEALRTVLNAWGSSYGDGGRGGTGGGPGAPTTHPLDRARQFAPGSRKAVLANTRSGVSRRTLMALSVNEGLHEQGCGIRIVPGAYVDPVPCTPSRSFHGVFGSDIVPADIQRVQRAVVALHAVDPLRALCLRVQFCTFGSKADKAEVVQEKWNEACAERGLPPESIGLRRYRELLERAVGWMHGRLST